MKTRRGSSRNTADEQPGPVLVLAPTGRDAPLLLEMFLNERIEAVSCNTPGSLCDAIDESAGCAVITEEAVSAEARGLLAGKLESQPPWSDFPLILLAKRTSGAEGLRRRFPGLVGANNVILLDRPLQKETLLSTVRSVLQSRLRQFQVRDDIQKRQALIDALPVLVGQVDRAGRCGFLNHTFAAWFGVDQATSVGRTLRELVGDAFYERLEPHLKSALAGRQVRLQETISGRPDRFVLLRLVPKLGPGRRISGLYIAATDVSDLRQSQEALVESNRLKNLALEGAALGVWMWRPEHGAIEWGPRTREIFGIPESETVDFEKFATLLHPEDRERVIADNDRARDPETTGTLSHRYRIVRPDAEVRWVDVQGGVVFEGEGTERRAVRVVGTIQDITHLKGLDAELQQRREQLELVHSALGIGTWEWRLAEEAGKWSLEMYELCGVDPDRPVTLKMVAESMHPEDRKHGWRRLTTLKDISDPEWHEEYRIQHPQKGVRWMGSFGRVEFDAAGHPERIFGITLDITERKAAEQKARETIATQALSAGLIRGQEEERTRLAREIHDDYAQRLAYISMGLDLLKRKSGASSEQVDALQDEATRLSDDMRELSHQLHPSQLDHFGLTTTLRAECERLSECTDVRIIFSGEGEVELSKELELNLYRITQEALQNVIKHASAKTAWVTLHCESDKTRLLVEDDGIGFDGFEAPGLGLKTMRERLRPFGGRLEIRSEPGSGTEIEVEVPV